MDFSFTEEQEKMRGEIRRIVAEEKAQAKAKGITTTEFADRVYSRIIEQGLIGLFVPRECGGLGRTPLDYGIYLEILHYVGAPEIVRTWSDINAIVMGALVTYGSHEVKKNVLTRICKGEIKSSVTWTEPDGGADGGAHKSRAVESGDYFIINATKIYNESHRCNYTFCMVKTDPDAPRGKGHTAFMIDLSSPGITMRPLWMMWGLRRDEVVFDNVKVPKVNMVGEKDQGWKVWYEGSQCLEWTLLGNTGLLKRDFENFVTEIKGISHQGKPLTDSVTTRSMLAEIALELELGRLLYYRAWSSAEGVLPDLGLASMAKVYTVELWERMYTVMIDILGQYGQIGLSPEARKWPGVRLSLPTSYEFGPALALGGMPTEIQRNTVASLKLRLPSYL